MMDFIGSKVGRPIIPFGLDLNDVVQADEAVCTTVDSRNNLSGHLQPNLYQLFSASQDAFKAMIK